MHIKTNIINLQYQCIKLHKMPELAEVETLKNYLQKNIINEQIIDLKARREILRSPFNIKEMQQHVLAGKILKVTRVAKFLSLELDNHYSIIFHLGMSGRLTVKMSDYLLQKHDHIIINFKSQRQLVFNDARRFGMVYSCKTSKLHKQSFLKNMGQEPLENEFNATYLLQKLSSKKMPIKTAIMDSKIVVGVGNIYAAESLFLAKINPLKQARTLQNIEVDNLVYSIKQVLNKAIKAGGTTLKDFVSGDNKPGYFQQELNVYDRSGQACYICKHIIEKIKQAGRTTCFCPKCQK
jgi:formamidopyrimidine-DNA glycosylase